MKAIIALQRKVCCSGLTFQAKSEGTKHTRYMRKIIELLRWTKKLTLDVAHPQLDNGSPCCGSKPLNDKLLP